MRSAGTEKGEELGASHAARQNEKTKRPSKGPEETGLRIAETRACPTRGGTNGDASGDPPSALADSYDPRQDGLHNETMKVAGSAANSEDQDISESMEKNGKAEKKRRRKRGKRHGDDEMDGTTLTESIPGVMSIPGAMLIPGPENHLYASNRSFIIGSTREIGSQQDLSDAERAESLPTSPFEEDGLVKAFLVENDQKDGNSKYEINSSLHLAEAVIEKPWYCRKPFLIVSFLLVCASILAIVLLTTISTSPPPPSSPSPTSSPVPTLSLAPSSLPTLAPTYIVPITVQIQLDDYPTDTGWILECDAVEIANVVEGSYDITRNIIETFMVPGEAKCVFKITDTNGDGICCDFSQGFYQVHFGDSNGDILLAGGKFQAAEVVSFTAGAPAPSLSPIPTASLTPSTSPSSSSAPSQSLWFQLGQDLVGRASDAEAGSSVALSSNGTIVAVGQPEDISGSVQVFRYIDSSGVWMQLGPTIRGEAIRNEFGYSVALSNDGSILAVGGRFNDGNDQIEAGHVRIYQYTTTLNSDGTVIEAWSQIGQDIEGENARDHFGSSVSLSSDGSMVAIGAPSSIGRGYTKVYQYESDAGSEWPQVGNSMVATTVADFHGASVSLSSDGTTIAVGSPSFNSEQADFSGLVQVFQLADDGTNPPRWNQIGQNFNGVEMNDRNGQSVSLASSGDILAIGADGAMGFSGRAQVFQFNALMETWSQVGQDILGEQFGEQFGRSVSLSANGFVLAVGAPLGSYAEVYEYQSNSNTDADAGSKPWTKVAQSLEGDSLFDRTGNSVSLSSDGSVIAFGSPALSSAGMAKVFTREG